MNILVFADVHGDKKSMVKLKEKVKQADLVLCAGDLTNFENNFVELLKEVDSWGVPCFFVHGNHEGEGTSHELIKSLQQVKYAHRKVFRFKDLYIFGWGGGGFTERDSEFEKKQPEFEKILKAKRFIFLTHAPPYNTPCDIVNEKHVGSKTSRAFIEKTQPLLCVAGHIHESAREVGRIGKCMCVNPGSEGLILKINKQQE
jgi:hypothetical protein